MPKSNQNFCIMKRTTTLLVLIALLIGFGSCKKTINNTNPEPVIKMRELIAPPTFDWLAYKTANLKIDIQSSSNLDGKPIFLYDDQYEIIETSVINGHSAAFNSKIQRPQTL